MINAPADRRRRACARSAITPEYGGFIDALGPGGGDETSMAATAPAAASRSPSSRRRMSRITPRILYQEIRANGFNRQEVYNLFANPVHQRRAPNGRAPVTFGERQQYLLLPESFADDTLLADLTAQIELSPIVSLTSIIDLYQPRHHGQPRRQRADRQRLGRSRLSECGGAAALEPGRHHRRSKRSRRKSGSRPTPTARPMSWSASSIRRTNRFYRQRLPTPGYDAFTDATLGAGTSAATRNGFPPNSPYNSDLPYEHQADPRCSARRRYDFTGRLHAHRGRRAITISPRRAGSNRAASSPTSTTVSTKPRRAASRRASS